MQFHYSPLNREKREIRLLKLDASTRPGTALLSYSLRQVSLDDEPDFIALSYVWGDQLRTSPIAIDGHEVSVTDGLYYALRELAREPPFRPLWADAVCINQRDNAEKTWQVQLMHNIYQSAHHVVAWLGNSRDDSDQIMHQLRRLGDKISSIQSAGPANSNERELLAFVSRDPWAQRKPTSTNFQHYVSHELQVGEIDDSQLRAFLNRPWWRRVWIVQECILAKSIVFACGLHRISFQSLQMAMALLAEWETDYHIQTGNPLALFQDPRFRPEHLNRTTSDRIANRQWNVMFRLRKGYQNKNSPSRFFLDFEDVLARMSGIHFSYCFFATDPRDMVYAVEQVAIDLKEGFAITPDYDKSCQQVYAETTRALLKNGTAALEYCVRPKLLPGLPSWAVDWTVRRKEAFRDTPWPRLSCPGYSASRRYDVENSESSANFFPDIDSCPWHILKVRGHHFDTINEVCPGLTFAEKAEYEGHPNDFCKLLLLPWLRRVYDFVSRSRRVGPGLRAKTVAARALLAGDALRVLDGDIGTSWEEAKELYRVVFSAIIDQGSSHVGSIGGCTQAFQPVLKQVTRDLGVTDLATLLAELSTFNVIVEDFNLRRSMFRTAKGYIGLSTDYLRVGDKVAILYGHDSPFLLRGLANGSYRLVGECYVDGIMRGEFMASQPPETIFQLM
jgi:hypothetical protein